jgi:hypothetical protein
MECSESEVILPPAPAAAETIASYALTFLFIPKDVVHIRYYINNK